MSFLMVGLRCIAIWLVGRGVVADSGCGSSCHGQCFAGRCLFAGDDLDIGSGATMPRQAAMSSITAEATNVYVPAVGRLTLEARRQTGGQPGQPQPPRPAVVTGGLSFVQSPPRLSKSVPQVSGQYATSSRSDAHDWEDAKQPAFSTKLVKSVGAAGSALNVSVPVQAAWNQWNGAANPSSSSPQLQNPSFSSLGMQLQAAAATQILPSPTLMDHVSVQPLPDALSSASNADVRAEAQALGLLTKDAPKDVVLEVQPHMSRSSDGALSAETLGDSEGTLQEQYERAHHSEVMLTNENNVLRRELARWRSASAKVVQREAQVVELIKQATNKASSSPSNPTATGKRPTSPAQRLSLLADTVQTYVFNAGKSPLRDSTNAGRLLLILVGVNCVLFVTWHFGTRNTSAKDAAMESLGFDLAKCGDASASGVQALRYIEPVLARLGLSAYTIEMSEIQVGNLSISRDVCVMLHIGSSQELRTRAGNFSDDLWRYDDIFKVKLSQREPDVKCVLWVVDREGVVEERVACFETTCGELLSMATERHREYFTFNLELTHGNKRHSTRGRRRHGVAGDDEMPFLALRMRDVTSHSHQPAQTDNLVEVDQGPSRPKQMHEFP